MVLHPADREGPGTTGRPEGRTVEMGDVVIVYEGYDCMKGILIEPNGKFQNRFGFFRVQDWVGKPYGSKVYGKAPGQGAQGWVYLLVPSAELWTQVLKHRTQILYVADIALICSFLELVPGSIVLESGTGSGSLTHSLARAVAPTGHVHTFEFHELRCQSAAQEFQQNGISHIVTVQQRNIEQSGFPESLHGQADGVFLDLPGPWKAVASATACLRPDGVLACFSPCIEQVQKTHAALSEAGYTAARTVEVLLRQYEVHQQRFTSGFEEPVQRPTKKRKRDAGDVKAVAATAPTTGATQSTAQPVGASTLEQPVQQQVVVSRPCSVARGHTGYLTFARKPVAL